MKLSTRILLTATVATTGASYAAPIATTTISGDNTAANVAAFVVSNTDLLQTNLASVTSAPTGSQQGWGGEFSGQLAALTNGTGGTITRPNPYAEITAIGPATSTNCYNTITYTLDTSANTLGYTLTKIASFSGAGLDRSQQHYAVAYSTVGAPTTFTDILADVNSSRAFKNYQNIAVEIADNTSAPLATNVKSIRFTFLSGQDNGGFAYDYSGYREIDVIGTPTAIPEPASLLLLSLSAIALLRRRR